MEQYWRDSHGPEKEKLLMREMQGRNKAEARFKKSYYNGNGQSEVDLWCFMAQHGGRFESFVLREFMGHWYERDHPYKLYIVADLLLSHPQTGIRLLDDVLNCRRRKDCLQ
ncbi:hypothetical protein GB937_009320 [Aspergillus fischeri]|nr:hypothetical protein GB937_009320 [Aspergillus fischeri]